MAELVRPLPEAFDATEPASPVAAGDLTGIPINHGAAHEIASQQDCNLIDELLVGVGLHGPEHQAAIGVMAAEICGSGRPCGGCQLWKYAGIAKVTGLTKAVLMPEEAE